MDFSGVVWGVHDEAAQFKAEMDKNFSRLHLYPFLEHVLPFQKDRTINAQAITNAFCQHPEEGQAWLMSLDPPIDSSHSDQGPYQNLFRRWFFPPIPTGTAYDPFSRIENVAGGWTKNPGELERPYQIAPLQFRIAQLELALRYGRHPTTEQTKEIMGDMLNYFLSAGSVLTEASDISDDAKFAEERKAAELNPDAYRDWGADYVRAGRETDAAAAYQTMSDTNA